MIFRSRPRASLLLVFVAFLAGPFALADGALGGSAADAFIARLKQSPARIEGLDGTTRDTSQLELVRSWAGNCCISRLTNRGPRPVRLGNIILFDLAEHRLDPATPIYGEGFQMGAQTRGPLGGPDYFGPYPDAHSFHIPQPDGLPTVYGMMTFDLGGAGHVLLGFTSCRRFAGRFSYDARRLKISMDPEGLELAPGETWNLEEFIAIAGPDRNGLLDELAERICHNHPPLQEPPLSDRAGWCTWYAVGGAGDQKLVTDSAAKFASILPEFRYIQIDEGYALEGDLLDVVPKFGDMQATVSAIRAKGFIPAIWVGPFVASPRSRTLAEHPDWFVQGPDGKPLISNTVTFGGWTNGPWRVLDGSNPGAQKHLESVFRTMREKWGITYFKLDANSWGAIRGGRHFDPKATRIEAYRRGMEAIVRGAGPGAVILGCNGPMWASFGLVNAMRTGNDISRSWKGFSDTAWENLSRGWQNGRLWVNDPDCTVQAGQPDLSPNIWRLHATVVHAVGGLVISGDKIADLGPAQLAVLRRLIPPTGQSARFETVRHEVGVTDLGTRQYYYAFNWADQPANRVLHLKKLSHLRDFWTDEDLGVREGDYAIQDLPARSARLIVGIPVN